MKSIAIIFSCSPFGNFLSKDGLDFSISLTAHSKNIEIFFIGDGVFQCLKNKNSKYIYCYDYTQRFEILKTLGVKKFYCDQSSLEDRGLLNIKNFIVTMNILNTKNFVDKLSFFDHVLNF